MRGCAGSAIVWGSGLGGVAGVSGSDICASVMCHEIASTYHRAVVPSIPGLPARLRRARPWRPSGQNPPRTLDTQQPKPLGRPPQRVEQGSP